MTFKPAFALAALAVFAMLALIFWAWRSSGLAIMQLGMNLC